MGWPPVLSSERLTTGGRRIGQRFTNGGWSRPSSCLENILWRGRREESREEGVGRSRMEEKNFECTIHISLDTCLQPRENVLTIDQSVN